MTDVMDTLFNEAEEYSGYSLDRDEFEAIVDVIKPMIEAQERERLANVWTSHDYLTPCRQSEVPDWLRSGGKGLPGTSTRSQVKP